MLLQSVLLLLFVAPSHFLPSCDAVAQTIYLAQQAKKAILLLYSLAAVSV